MMPDVALSNPGEPPLGTIAGRGTNVPVVNCPKPENGERCPVEKCNICSNCGEIGFRYLECSYKPSQKDKDELERRKKGVGTTMKSPIQPQFNLQPPKPVPDRPKTVFNPNQ